MTFYGTITRDTTEKKYAKDAILESEARFRVFMEQAPVAIGVFNLEGIGLYANGKFIETLGLQSVEKMVGRPAFEYFAPQFREQSKERTQRRLQGLPVPAEYESIALRADGSEFPVHMAVAPIELAGGTASIAFLTDITDRKKAEHDQKVSEINLRMILDSVDDAIFIYTKEGKIVDVNNKMLKMYRVSREEVCSMSIEEDFSTPANPLNELPGIWESVVKGEENLFEWEARRPHDGSSFNAEVFLRKINMNSEDFILAAVRDITDRKLAEAERKKMENQLSQSQKLEAIGTLTGGIAHDFNNILAGIIGYTELVLDGKQQEKNQEYLLQTLKGAERAKNLVKQILTFSRQDDHDKKPLDIKLLLKEAVKFLRASIPSTIEIQQNMTNESCNIMADPTQMHQVIMNLCTNASHAMKKTGGILKIELSPVELAEAEISRHPDLQPGPYIKLTVSDTGQGIAPEHIQRIFDPFFTTKSNDEGTGLGLSVVYGIVKNHNGVIHVYSEPDKGAVFNVYLPRIIHFETGKVDMDKPVAGGKERILFVDDEPTLVDLEMRILSSLGYEVTGMTSSEEALEVFRAKPQGFDLVITDMTLPKMTGIELSRQIMQIRPDIPIVLCSGIREADTEANVQSLGIRAYMIKPLTRKELARVVRKTLDGQDKPVTW